MRLPLTLPLSPYALKSATGRGNVPNDQQLRAVPGVGRGERDQVLGQLEVEQVGAHVEPRDGAAAGVHRDLPDVHPRPDACPRACPGPRPTHVTAHARPMSRLTPAYVSPRCHGPSHGASALTAL